MKRSKRIILVIFIFIFLIGFGLFMYPYINGAILKWRNQTQFQSFLQLQEYSANESATLPSEEEITKPDYKQLKIASREYNTEILRNNQFSLRNGYFENPCLDLLEYELEDGIFAVMEIPALELEMPIYLGANTSNLAIGAAHMTGSSLPIGGKNSNCLIAGHRGWKGATYFKNLPKLQLGDEIIIHNLWETLKYEVIDETVAYNTESVDIYIQDGRDLVTLLTCDYGDDGEKFRYIAICERVE